MVKKTKLIELDNIAYDEKLHLILKHRKDMDEVCGGMMFKHDNTLYAFAENTVWIYHLKKGEK